MTRSIVIKAVTLQYMEGNCGDHFDYSKKNLNIALRTGNLKFGFVKQYCLVHHSQGYFQTLLLSCIIFLVQ